MKKILVIASFFYSYNLSYCTDKSDNLTLELLQVIFRHGDRYPDRSERRLDKSDTYNHIFENFKDYGKLTKEGMLREYNFGKMLRERYNDFLGSFKYQDVYARSTDFDRTKMTLTLALAGLYPPTEETSWSDIIYWSPIPTYYNPKNSDFLRVTTNGDCVKRGKLLAEIDKLPEVSKRLETFRNFYEELKQKTNINEFKPSSLHRVYSYVRSLLAMDLPLPDWCSQEDYKKLEELADIHYESFGLTAAFRKATAGPTVDQILRNIQGHKKDGKKIYLYAAHEINIATFLQAHNFTGIPSTPDFGSAVIIEKLRGDDDHIYLRMFYWTGVSEELIPLNLKSCDHVCLLADYKDAVKSMIPNDKEKMCFSPERFCNKDKQQ